MRPRTKRVKIDFTLSLIIIILISYIIKYYIFIKLLNYYLWRTGVPESELYSLCFE
jgi:hypothetical protein